MSLARILAIASVVVGSLSLFGACHGEQKLHSDCIEDPGACPACTSDQDCVIQSNSCQAHAYCTHRDRNPPLNFPSIGCGSWSEYDVPPDSKCGCVESICRAR